MLAGVPVALVNPTYPERAHRAHARPARAATGARRGRDRLGATRGSGTGGRPARAGRRPVRRRVVPAHVRHDRAAEVLRADARLLRPARGRDGRRARPDQPPTGCSRRCRCSTSTRWATASSPRCCTGADALTVGRFSASGFWPAVVAEQVSVLILHAPPVEILKRATTADDAAGHRVRTMFYADGEFLRRFGIPAAVSGYGSTEAGGVCHLRRWSASEELPADAGRHGGAPRADIEWKLARRHDLRPRARARRAVRRLRHERRPRSGARRRRLVRHRRPRPARRRRLPGVPRARRGVDPGQGRVRPDPVRRERTRRAGARRPRDVEAPRARSSTTRSCCTSSPTTCRWTDSARASRELPPFMRPVAVARVDALPRDAAAGKVQRRLARRASRARLDRTL